LLLVAAGGGRPSLIEAARNSEREALRALLQHGASANATEADGDRKSVV
jgi:hypothetical protein